MSTACMNRRQPRQRKPDVPRRERCQRCDRGTASLRREGFAAGYVLCDTCNAGIECGAIQAPRHEWPDGRGSRGDYLDVGGVERNRE